MITAQISININKKVCLEGENPFHCFDSGKVGSAIASALYPGNHPYQHGGISEVAGALAFYICQAHAFQDGNKRTASLATLVLLHKCGFGLNYQYNTNSNEFSEMIIQLAQGAMTIGQVKKWFLGHSIKKA